MGTILKNGVNYSGASGGGSGVSSYNELTDKPSINNVTLTGNKTTADLGITSATKTSDLTNDSGFYSSNDTAETTIADADYFPFYDTSASGRRKSLWSNIKSVLKTYFDTKYQEKLICLDATILFSSGIISTNALAFSTSEKAVGQWTNGLTLYQKTLSLGTFPNNGTKSVAHGISGNFTIVDLQGVVTGKSGNGNYQQYALPFVSTSGLSGYVYRDGSNLVLANNFDGTAFNCYVTLRYVKSNL